MVGYGSVYCSVCLVDEFGRYYPYCHHETDQEHEYAGVAEEMDEEETTDEQPAFRN